MSWDVFSVVRRIVFAALVIALLAPVVPAAIVHAAGNFQYVSAYLDDPGTQTDCRAVATGCSLRDALHAAANGDTIQFSCGIFGWPITYTLDPARGTLIASHSVTIQGPGADNLTISGGNAVSVFTVNSGVSDDGTALTLTVPAHSTGNVGFAVANPSNGHVAAGTLTYVPVMTSLSATSGAATGGSHVTITGAGFVAGGTSVMFGTTPAAVTNMTATTLTVTAPAHGAGTVDVMVTVNGVSGTKAGTYTYGTVNPIAPPRPPTGSPVTGKPIPMPSSRTSVGAQAGPTPNPLPPSR